MTTKQKRRGIMMSTYMMQALDINSKTETRRLSGFELINKNPEDWTFKGYHAEPDLLGREVVRFKNKEGEDCRIKCRYGSAGHLLYTRETFCTQRKFPNANFDSPRFQEREPVYKAEKQEHVAKLMKWTPAIHMPAEFARYDLLIREVYAERLRDVTEESAIAEGVIRNDFGFFHYVKKKYILATAVQSYMSLIALLHGDKTVELNPWLWRILFTPSKIK